MHRFGAAHQSCRSRSGFFSSCDVQSRAEGRARELHAGESGTDHDKRCGVSTTRVGTHFSPLARAARAVHDRYNGVFSRVRISGRGRAPIESAHPRSKRCRRPRVKRVGANLTALASGFASSKRRHQLSARRAQHVGETFCWRRDEGRSSYPISLHVCAACGGGAQLATGELVHVDSSVVDRAACDAQHLDELLPLAPAPLTTPRAANENAIPSADAEESAGAADAKRR